MMRETERERIRVSPDEQGYTTRDGGKSKALMSLGDVAAHLGISRARAHQIERNAI